MREQLAGWANFYVIVGSSAGALIGLQFVVIALLSSQRTRAVSIAMRAFATPTIVYFSAVLLTAGLLNIPHHTLSSLTAVLIAVGSSGLGYVGWVARHMRRQDAYAPDGGDWAWFIALPAAAFVATIVAGALVFTAPGFALVVTGSAAMLLLFVGVHNAWDSAVYMVANPPQDRQ